MNFLLFTLFSSAEYIAIIGLMFALFRFRFKGYWSNIALVCAVLSYVSYTMRAEELSNLTTIVQFVLLFLFVWQLFQVQIFYAAIISFASYFTYGLLQASLVVLGQSAGLFQIEDIKPNSLVGYSLQICSILLALSVRYLIKLKRGGFNFVPTVDSLKIKYKGLNAVLAIVIPLFAIVIAFVYYVTNSLSSFEDSVIFIVCLVVSLSIIYFLSIRKEKQDDKY